jgi:purine-cytosine permease-like protein
MKRASFFLAFAGVILGALATVRLGAIVVAFATALFITPDFRQARTIEKIVPVALIVSLITIALALPRR